MISMPLVVFLLTFAASSMGQKSTPATIKGKIDVAILMPYAIDDASAKKIKAAWMDKLAANVKLETEARISIVAFQRNGAVVLVNRKSSMDVAKKDIANMSNPIHSDHNHAAAFDKLATVFDSNRDRQKVIIAYIPAPAKDGKKAESKAKVLRDKGVLIYVIYEKSAKAAAESYAGDAKKTIEISMSEMSSDAALQKISDVVGKMSDDADKKPTQPTQPKSVFEDTTTLIIVASVVGGGLFLVIILVTVVIVRKRSKSAKLREEEAKMLKKMYIRKNQLLYGSLMPSTVGKGKESSVMASKKDGKSMVGGASKMSPSAKSPKK